MRLAFRRVPQSQWKDLMQQISYGLGFEGTVSEASASTPEMVTEPFHFAYSYNRKDYPDWSNHQFTVPGLPFLMPRSGMTQSDPIWLGSPQETISDSKVEVPQGYEPQLPANVDLKYDFAEYHASYSVVYGVLTAKRSFLVKQHEVPVAEFGNYRNFVKTLQNDVNQYVQTSSVGASIAPKVSATPNALSSGDAAPLGKFASRATWEQFHRREPTGIRGARRHRENVTRKVLCPLCTAQSRSIRNLRELGLCSGLLLMQKQKDAGIDAFQKAIASDPNQPAIPKALGLSLMGNSQFEDAIPVWKDYTKAHPEDLDGVASLGACLQQLKRYSEAVTVYEAAVKTNESTAGTSSEFRFSISSCRRSGEGQDWCLRNWRAWIRRGKTFNDVAYQMANADLDLPVALDYAKKAVHAAEEESQKITLADLTLRTWGKTEKLAAYWDTLGWVDDRMSKLDEAEVYLQAAWKLTQDGVVASHLCQVYERLHKTASAIRMCRLAVYRIPMSEQLALRQYKPEMDEAQHRLDHLTGSSTASKGAGYASECGNP